MSGRCCSERCCRDECQYERVNEPLELLTPTELAGRASRCRMMGDVELRKLMGDDGREGTRNHERYQVVMQYNIMNDVLD